MDDVTSNPSLYSVPHELKVDDGLVLPVVTIDLFDLQVGQHDGGGYSIVAFGLRLVIVASKSTGDAAWALLADFT